MLMEEPRKSWVKRSVFTKIFWGGPGPNDKGLSRKHILDAQHITEAWGIAEKSDLVGPIVEQPLYNFLSRHSEYLPLHTNFGLSLTTHY
ncbi:hypothetical protein D5086_021209 [Populus alba]|uniref:Uncharacterized protein n=1 Tax=Populus alba TaxID=43335 RepID=A0ACC4BC30_POPAL